MYIMSNRLVTNSINATSKTVTRPNIDLEELKNNLQQLYQIAVKHDQEMKHKNSVLEQGIKNCRQCQNNINNPVKY
ncbi:hypothetical protein QLL95_gp1117 [Cotonvirus japonicus]|uniref:Uncharacterized protein n=1 Tax=Cotonvirus japonicus TaxID=2811091 RepID=A0ABM7NSC5_9VIRU|nr:hypothetical protein QLL95_gp1117 [Cotonvirus japonicus]BCS83006.1 hypothetical protein [Cotonvirus japonicus]